MWTISFLRKLAIILLLTAQNAFAASGWDGHATKMLYFQIVNVVVLLGAFIYFLKDPVREFFKSRANNYHLEAQKAQARLKEAQNKLEELQLSLTKIETTWAEALSRAQAEATELREKMNRQSDESTQRLLEDAKRAIQAEQHSLYQNIIADLVASATAQVEQKLKTQLSDEDHKRLQKNFNNSVEGSAT